MAEKNIALLPKSEKILAELGEDIKLARREAWTFNPRHDQSLLKL